MSTLSSTTSLAPTPTQPEAVKMGSKGVESVNSPSESLKRPAEVLGTDEPTNLNHVKKTKIGFREIEPFEVFRELEAISLETGRPVLSLEAVKAIYSEYEHTPTHREWTALENCQLVEMLQKFGFGADVMELNKMLPTTVKGVEAANLMVWKSCAHDLNINCDVMYANQQKVEQDKVKWSRRAVGLDKNGQPRNGQQNKIARHNSCITDLEEPIHDLPNTIIGDNFVKHPHPKNPNIKYTNYGFEAFPELKKFRRRLAHVYGPFGYKLFGQFFELNHYYDKKCGIGRHGDIERGQGESQGQVNCLKLGYAIPLLFSWYHHTKPVGLDHALPSDVGHYPLVPFQKGPLKAPKWTTSTVAAVVKLGHGNYYQMSGKTIGRDWTKSSKYSLRHCAGAAKYTGLGKEWYTAETGELPTAYSLTGSDRVENDSESPELQFATRWDGM